MNQKNRPVPKYSIVKGNQKYVIRIELYFVYPNYFCEREKFKRKNNNPMMKKNKGQEASAVHFHYCNLNKAVNKKTH